MGLKDGLVFGLVPVIVHVTHIWGYMCLEIEMRNRLAQYTDNDFVSKGIDNLEMV